jgi:ketol-acid reductoisomerase
MENPASLQGKSVHIVNGDAAARKAYEEVFLPFIKAGTALVFHDSPNAFFNAVRPDAQPDMLITAPYFEGDFDGVGLVSRLHRDGFAGSSLVASGIAARILDGAGELRRIVRKILTGCPDEVYSGFIWA